jgi:predicted kinase
MFSAPETLNDRFNRVAKEQKRTLVVRADDFRANEHGVYSHEGDLGIIAWRMAQRSFTELLSGVDLVVALAGAPGAGKTTWVQENRRPGVLYLDATLSRRKTRREVCGVTASAGRPIYCVFLDVDLDVCLTRNATRSPDRRVPPSNIEQAHHRLTVCPPDVDEGWRRVRRLGPVRVPVSVGVDDMLDRSSGDL